MDVPIRYTKRYIHGNSEVCDDKQLKVWGNYTEANRTSWGKDIRMLLLVGNILNRNCGIHRVINRKITHTADLVSGKDKYND